MSKRSDDATHVHARRDSRVPRAARPASPECDVTIVDVDAVTRATAAVPDGASLAELEGIFAALSDRTRLRILAALASEPLCVCDLAEVARVSQSAVSHQLRVLRDLRLVGFEREGKRAVYRLADDHVRALLAQGLEHAAEREGAR